MNFNWVEDNNDYLIYIGDAMCSWCHGFSPELDQVILDNPNFDLKLVMGGLRPYNTEKAIVHSECFKNIYSVINKFAFHT